jgi:hypothetical protein
MLDTIEALPLDPALPGRMLRLRTTFATQHDTARIVFLSENKL